MAKLNHDEIEEGETNSTKSLSGAATQSGTKTSPTLSSSLRFSTDDEGEAEDGQGKKRTGRTFEEIACEVIREMREVEEREEIKETRGAGEPLQIPVEAANREPREDPIREIYDLTDEEEVAASDGWKSQMEENVNLLIAENTEQNAMLKAQGEQMTKMVDLVDRVISWIDRETQSSNQPSPAVSAAGRNAPQQTIPDTNLAGTSRKRNPTTTTNQLPSTDPASSAAKRIRHSGSHGRQKKN